MREAGDLEEEREGTESVYVFPRVREERKNPDGVREANCGVFPLVVLTTGSTATFFYQIGSQHFASVSGSS